MRREADLYEAEANILKAMAHPGRLSVLYALEDGERSVSELQRRMGTDLSTVSRHLSAMKAAGLLSSRREGPHTLYRLRVPCVLRFLGCLDAVLDEDLQRHRRLARVRQA